MHTHSQANKKTEFKKQHHNISLMFHRILSRIAFPTAFFVWLVEKRPSTFVLCTYGFFLWKWSTLNGQRTPTTILLLIRLLSALSLACDE